MADQYFLRQGSRISGPFTAKAIKKLAASGGVDQNDEISSDSRTWQVASSVRGLAFGGAAPVDRPYYVFLSHSSQDKVEADIVCARLEAAGIPCWIAPRDILPGTEWAEGISEGIDQSRIMVLLFTENANNSSQVRREVERAANKRRTIIPLRLQNLMPTHALEYFLSNTHWLDAFTPPLEQHTEQLVSVIRRIVREETMAGTRASDNPGHDATSRYMPALNNSPIPTNGTQGELSRSTPTPSSPEKRRLIVSHLLPRHIGVATAWRLAGLFVVAVLVVWTMTRFLETTPDQNLVGTTSSPIEQAAESPPKPAPAVEQAKDVTPPTPPRDVAGNAETTPAADSSDASPTSVVSALPVAADDTLVSDSDLDSASPADPSVTEPPPARRRSRPSKGKAKGHQDSRTRWVGESGNQFVRVGEKLWSEQDADGHERYACEEVTQTKSYVEIKRDTGLRIRLYDNHIDFKTRKGRNWSRVQDGTKHPNLLPTHGGWR